MGKNQQHKMMQRSRGGAEEGPAEGGTDEPGTDASFHTAEWHAARIAALTTERMSWEDWKKVQKQNAAIAAQAADEEEAQMREYRAQLDADRQKRLSKGTNNSHLRAKTKDLKSKKSKKDKKRKAEKDGKAKKSKKHKRKKERRRSSSTSSSKSSGSSSSSKSNSAGGPVRLSDFFRP